MTDNEKAADVLRWEELPGVELAVTAVRNIKGRRVPTSISVTCDSGVDGELLRKIPLGRIEALLNADSSLLDRYIDGKQKARSLEETHQRLDDFAEKHIYKLSIPSTGKYPDEFYKHVADAWQLLASQGSPPAKRLAVVNNVPESTTNRWAKEARRRGFLPPARRKTGS